MDIARLGIKVQSGSVRRASQDLSAFNRHSRDAGASTETLGRKSSAITGAVKGMAVQVAAAAGGMALLTKSFGAAEQYTNMQNRLLALGASHESAAAQIQQLADIAKDTRAPLESTVELYSRLSLTADSLGASQGELMEFTETVGLALAASGTSAGQASGALTQLSQAMAGGVVRAEEFNSMIEGAPGLLMAVADGIEGVNGDLGALRQMMLDGELTSEAFFDALLSQNEALAESFDRTSPTIASAFGVLNDQFTLFIGEADQATGVTTTIAEAMLLLAENMDVAVPVFGAVALGVAAISAPILAAGVAIGALAVAVITHWDEIKAGFSAGVDYVLAAGKRFLDWVTPFAEMTPLGFLVINTVRYWDEIKKAFTDGVDFVVGLGPRLVDALKDAASQALDAALSIGTEIINGIKAGIDNKWQEIKDRILSLGDSLPNWLRESLGIASPAREMIPIGEYAIDGVIVGLDNREDALRLKSEGIGEQIGKGIKDGLDPVLETIFDGLAKGDLGSIGSRILSMGQGSFSGLLQSSASGGGNFLGNVFGGLQSAWSGVTSAIGGIASGATGIISGIGGAISSALPIVGAVSAVANLFKSTEVLVAEGVRVRMSETLAALDTYEKTKRENGFGFSSGFSRDFDEMDQAVQDALGARVAATIDNLAMFGLGTDLSGFEFSKRTEIKDGETLQGEMEEVIREALDAAVQYATEGALDGFTQTGETVSQALDRLAASLNGVNPVLDMLGQSLLPVSLDGAAAATSLLELAGGLEAFSTNAVFVFDNFLTDAEQQARLSAVAMDQLNAAFDDLNMDVPATHAAFMDLMDAQDLTTEGGRQMYAALLDIAPLFVTVKGTAQEVADAAANDLNPALNDTGDAARDAAAAARELAAQQREQQSLLLQIARATGNVAYIREQELAALNEANRPLQEHIYMLEDEANARQSALESANALVDTMEGNLADANRNLEQAYSDLRGAVNDRLRTLEQERDGYLAAADAAREALVALGAIAETQTPLERAQEATRAYEDALSNLSAGINRERSAPESSISGLESEAQSLRDALFPSEETDIVDALTIRDVMGEALEISERLANAARDVLRLNSDIVEQQRESALAQLRAMLSTGNIDAANIDRIVSDATSFRSADFASFEEMSLAQKQTAGLLNDLSELQADLGSQAQAEEEARAEEARRVALDQLAALESQINQAEQQIAGLDALADRFGLIEAELSSGQLAQIATELKAAADAANAEAVAFYTEELAANTALADAASEQIDALQVQYGAILSVDNSVRAVEQAVANLATAQQAVADATQALADAQAQQTAAQQAIDQAGNLSAAEARLLSILGATDGGAGAALLQADALGQMSEDQMNAMLTSAGVAALTGTARDVAMAYLDELGRNVDVAGLEFYVDGLVSGAITLAGVVDDLATSTEAITGVMPGFAIPGVPTAPIPSYAQGTDYHAGGLARLHENELVNLPRGTSVSTAGEVREMVNEIKELRKSNQEMAVELRQIRRFAQSRTDIIEDQRAEQLAAEASA